MSLKIRKYLSILFGVLLVFYALGIPLKFFRLSSNMAITYPIGTNVAVNTLAYDIPMPHIATIISVNPLVWIINGIYLKNRWCHPKVNNGQEC